MIISEKSFKDLPIDNKLDTIYDTLSNLESKIEIIGQKCERKRMRDTSFATGGGLIAAVVFLISDKIESFKSILKIFK